MFSNLNFYRIFGIFLYLSWGVHSSKLSSPLSSSGHGHHHALGSLTTQQTSNGLQCQRIAVSACHGVGYNMTAFPNLAGHTNQLEAELRVSKPLFFVEIFRVVFSLCFYKIT